MVQLAIKGHPTRGSEVIALLKMLGGKEEDMYSGTEESWVYTINEEGFIEWDFPCDRYVVYSLEEFLEKFPYKVGDKVIAPVSHNIHTIESMHWNGNKIYYNTVGEGFNTSYTAKDLQPYKEKTMEEITDKAIAPVLTGEDLSEKRFGYKIPNGYEFDCIKHNEIIIKPKQPQYPATYEECCKVLNKRTFFSFNGLSLEEIDLYKPFIKLMRCRDAYWKVAGEQMGLGKPFEPDTCQIVYSIGRYSNEIVSHNGTYGGLFILEFPTAEMRDTFYDNFKDLIEECKELL